jgi:hypothetical protein
LRDLFPGLLVYPARNGFAIDQTHSVSILVSCLYKLNRLERLSDFRETKIRKQDADLGFAYSSHSV